MAEATIGHLIEEVRVTSSQEQKKTEEVKKEISSLTEQFSSFFKLQKQQALDALEEKRESKPEKVGDDKDINIDIEKAKKDMPFLYMIGAVVGAISGLIVGAVEGFVGAAKLILKGLVAPFKLLVKGVNTAFSKFFPNTAARIRSTIRSVADGFRRPLDSINKGLKAVKGWAKGINARILNVASGIGQSFRNGLNGISSGIRGVNGKFRKLNFADRIAKAFGGITRFTKNTIGSIRTFMSGLPGIGGFFKDIGKVSSGIGNKFKSVVSGVSKTIGTFFKTMKTAFMGGFSKFFSIFRVVGRVIFFPITIIMSIIDAIKGFKEGFASSGGSMIGGVLGAISGVLQGIIGMPLDLLKNIVAWIADKLGFENFADMLGEFSFSELIGGLFDKLTDTLLGFFDAMKDETGSFNFGKILKVVFGTLINTVTMPFRLLLEGLAMLAEKIPLVGDDLAAGIRGFKDMITIDTGVGEAAAARGTAREQYRTQEEERERLARLEETPREQTTAQMDEGTTDITQAQQPPVVVNQVDASTVDNSTRSSSSTGVLGSPSPSFDISGGNRFAYV